MIRALVAKELRQHGAAFLALAALLVVGLWGIAGNPLLRRALGSGFEGLALLLKTLVPLGGLVLSNTLIAAEFRHKTQMFLEGLPLPRWRMLAIKYVMMVGSLLGAVLLAALAAAWRGRHGEAMTPGFAWLLAAKTAAWTWFVGAAFFAVGFLGRYRIGIAFVTVVILAWMSASGVVELGRHAPFSLLDDRFAYEREVWPRSALLWSVAWALAFSAFGFTLGLVKDATLATLLAEKMSPREKAWVTLSLITLMMVLATADERRKNREAVTLPGSLTQEPARGVRLEIATSHAPTAAEVRALESTGTNVAAFLAEFAVALGGRLPPVFLVHRPDLENGEIQNGDLSAEQGVLLRANLLATNFSPARLERELVREILKARTQGRSEKEPWAWLADGLPRWWAARGQATNGLAADAELAGAARKARTAVTTNAAPFSRWLTVRREAGTDGAEALSWSALQLLSTRHGRDAVLALVRDCFGRPVAKDARAWLGEKLRPPEQRLRQSTGMDFTQLARALEQELGNVPEAKP